MSKELVTVGEPEFLVSEHT